MATTTTTTPAPTTDHGQAVFEFAHAIKEALITGVDGVDGFGKPQRYVSPGALLKYWTPSKISEIIKANDVYIPKEMVRKDWIRVFSVLVYCNRASDFQQFMKHGLRDHTLPLVRFPPCWPNTPVYRALFESFDEHQWIFCPLVFDQLTDLIVDPKQILPLQKTKISGVSEDETSQVYEVELEASCDKLQNKTYSGNPNHTFVLKTYTGMTGRKLYENERKALTALQDRPSNHIVGFFGSFTHNGTYNLVLEFVNGGNLLDFFKTTPPPRCLQDVHHFWTSYKGIFEGAQRIHQLTEYHDHADTYRVVHQDIKPHNILLTRQGGASPYHFQAKIADFGHSHVRPVQPNGEDKLGLDRQGGQMYSAPECSRHEPGPNRITAEADIFSLGCLTSDAAAWVALGQSGRVSYLEKRSTEISKLQSFRGSAYGNCFHNGVEMLKAVRDMHTRIQGQLPQHDDITPSITKVAEDHMLCRNPSSRWPAKRLKERFGHVLDGYLDPLHGQLGFSTGSLKTPSSTRSSVHSSSDGEAQLDERKASAANGQLPSTTPAGPRSNTGPTPVRPPLVTSLNSVSDPGGKQNEISRSRLGSIRWQFRKSLSPRTSNASNSFPDWGGMSSSEPTLTREEAVKWREARKSNMPVDHYTERKIESLRGKLRGRDHLFLIDDSPTMAHMSAEVNDAFATMSYIAKQIDPDALELAFTSDPADVRKSSNTTPLVDLLTSHRYSDGITLMEQSMYQFVDKIVTPHLRNSSSWADTKPISIFLFTDGRWGNKQEKAAGVQRPIERLMRKMLGYEIPRTQVMIQLVRFGDDADGQQYLNYLDTFGKKKGCDIVDTKPWRGANLWAMFIGSICEVYDGKDEVSDDAPRRLSFGLP